VSGVPPRLQFLLEQEAGFKKKKKSRPKRAVGDHENESLTHHLKNSTLKN
jgi:hypothetical protein